MTSGASVRSGEKCGYESGDLVTVRDEGDWHDNCGKEHTVQVCTDDKSTKLLHAEQACTLYKSVLMTKVQNYCRTTSVATSSTSVCCHLNNTGTEM